MGLLVISLRKSSGFGLQALRCSDVNISGVGREVQGLQHHHHHWQHHTHVQGQKLKPTLKGFTTNCTDKQTHKRYIPMTGSDLNSSEYYWFIARLILSMEDNVSGLKWDLEWGRWSLPVYARANSTVFFFSSSCCFILIFRIRGVSWRW